MPRQRSALCCRAHCLQALRLLQQFQNLFGSNSSCRRTRQQKTIDTVSHNFRKGAHRTGNHNTTGALRLQHCHAKRLLARLQRQRKAAALQRARQCALPQHAAILHARLRGLRRLRLAPQCAPAKHMQMKARIDRAQQLQYFQRFRQAFLRVAAVSQAVGIALHHGRRVKLRHHAARAGKNLARSSAPCLGHAAAHEVAGGVNVIVGGGLAVRRHGLPKSQQAAQARLHAQCIGAVQAVRLPAAPI